MASGPPLSLSRRTTPSRRGRSVSAAAKSTSPSHNHTNNTQISVNDRTIPDDPPATKFSSLSIAVEGAVPIHKANGSAPPVNATASASYVGGEMRRAPRKSKTDALAALNTRSRSPSLGIDDGKFTQPNPAPHATNTTPISISAALNLDSVKSTSPRNPPKPITPRPFDLEDCPTYYPSPEEFKDPLGFVRSITAEAKQYGLAKIVPPIGWKMPFVTDTETFRFKTRIQRLNSMEASSRAKINFLEALYRFHKQRGRTQIAVPTINHQPIDLWSFRNEVRKLGGFETVNQTKRWADIGRLLGYTGIPGLSTQLRNSYIRVIRPYEEFQAGVQRPSTNSGSQAQDASASRDSMRTPPPGENGAGPSGSASPLGSPLSNTSSPLSEPPDDEMNGNGDHRAGSPRPRKHGVNGIHIHANGRTANGVHDSSNKDGRRSKLETTCCEICHRRNRGMEMLLCDGCDCGFHIFCLKPPLSMIPKGQWFCDTCVVGTGGDFGFDEGEEHSLSSFQARDKAFRQMWFTSHPPPLPSPDDPTVTTVGNIRVSEYDTEREFWRLVQSPYETVEIEYGADVHSTTHGSAMPTLEMQPLNPYSRDPWNLNNIPILQDSLLRYIKSEINGMTVPWTYVGMIFSTFCWHNEDHFTYSINYMHWGETKTWYGIPGEDAEKFEAAIKKEAPDLFESQPDLLFQLVTLMNPARLTQSGVRVFACNQRAGEFVVTFPKAYHAGFNHGFNFNEAVNFALPDWLPYGRECVRRYQEHRKLPVFSHEELLITISQQSHSIQTAIWLNESFEEMVDRELTNRRAIRDLGVPDRLEERDHPEDQYQCTYCKAFCYLSQIICSCAKPSINRRPVCLEHNEFLCDCKPTSRILRLRFSDEELRNMKTSISSRAQIPTAWRNKLMKSLKESPRPQLRALRALVAEADRINYPLSELAWLRKCVNRANEWVDTANSFITRKQSRKRSKRHRWQPVIANGAGASDDVTDRPEKNLEEVYTLLQEVENLGFDCQEISLLRNLATSAEDFKAKAALLLQKVPDEGDRATFLQECETLLAHGSSLNVHLEELYKVESIVLQEQLMKELQDFDDSNITLDETRHFLARAKACDLPDDNKYMKLLEDKLRAGNDWDERAANILKQPIRTIDELNEFFEVEPNVPVDPAVLNRISTTRSRALELEKQAKAWLSPESGAALPRVQDALRLVQRAEKEFHIPAIEDLKRTADFASDLEERCDSVLKCRYQHNEEGSIFSAISKWTEYAQEHLMKFTLPNYDKLNKQLELHQQWIKKLPWYCPDHESPHGREILHDVIEYTKPEDDTPPEDEFFTCICFEPVRPPPPGKVSDAVQCDHCFARFHGGCAANGGSCPFCDPNHWNGTIHRDRSWHFCYLPTVLQCAPEITKNYSGEWKELETIVQHIERLCGVIGHFLSFASQPGNQKQEYIPQVRHHMRKLYKIQFAVSPNPEVSFGLDLAGLHRILASRPPPVRLKKRRRPRFVFGQDVDKDWVDGTRCICRGQTPYLRGFALVVCELCNRKYHAACVCYKGMDQSTTNLPFTCPLCSLRKAKPYRWADIRVRFVKDTDAMVYVDVKACIENFSRELIRIKLTPPVTPTIFIDLVQFTPGQPDALSSAAKITSTTVPPSVTNGNSIQGGRVALPILPQHPSISQSSSSTSNAPPPPPWNRSDSVSSAPTQSNPTEPLVPFKRKRKLSATENGRESVLIFEVDNPIPSTGSPSTHRGVHHTTPTSLNIIMQSPSQMAAAHKEAELKKTSPPATSPLPGLPFQKQQTPTGQRSLPAIVSPYKRSDEIPVPIHSPHRRPEETTPHHSPRSQVSIPVMNMNGSPTQSRVTTMNGSPTQSRPPMPIGSPLQPRMVMPTGSPSQSRASIPSGSPTQSRASIPLGSPIQPRTYPPPLPTPPGMKDRPPSLPAIQTVVSSASAAAPVRKVKLHVRDSSDPSS